MTRATMTQEWVGNGKGAALMDLDYAEPCIEARRLVNAISDACKLKEWDKAFSLQQELDGACMDIGEAIVAGMDRGRQSSI